MTAHTQPYGHPIVLDAAKRERAKAALEARSMLTGSGCLLWTGTTNRDGYGTIYFEGRRYNTSRLAFAAWQHDPGTASVLHRCDNPPCFLSEHLFAGSQRDNMADRNAKGRQAKGEANGRNKITTEAVLLIRELAGEGYPVTRLGRAFGIDPTTVRDIVTGEIWAAVSRA